VQAHPTKHVTGAGYPLRCPSKIPTIRLEDGCRNLTLCRCCTPVRMGDGPGQSGDHLVAGSDDLHEATLRGRASAHAVQAGWPAGRPRGLSGTVPGYVLSVSGDAVMPNEDVLDHLLELVEPGTLTLLVGRPGSGVTTTIARAAKAWLLRGGISAMACWECPASSLRPWFEGSQVLVPDFLGWSVAELDLWLGNAGVPAGALIGVDYLQLVAGPLDTAAALAQVARRRDLRLLVGAMGTRKMAYAAMPSAVLVQRVAADIHGFRSVSVEAVERVALLVHDGPDGRRRLIISKKRPHLDQRAVSGALPHQVR
jgi:hypothetical protein